MLKSFLSAAGAGFSVCRL